MAFSTNAILKWTMAVLLVVGWTSVTESRVMMGYNSRGSCPSPEFIYPCSCRMTVYGMHVVCLRVPATQLELIFKTLQGYQVGTLLLQEINLPPKDRCGVMFHGMKVVILRLVSCKIPDSLDSLSETNYILDGLNSTLKRIDITNCEVGTEGVNYLGLGRLPQLTDVNVHQESLATVKKSWFSGSGYSANNVNIRVVRLEDSEICELEHEAFASLTHLTVLSLAKNSINNIRRDALPKDANQLTTIDLSTNSLTGLPDNFFTNMPALKKVLLYNNNIHRLREQVWGNIFQQLDTLWIYDNPLYCDKDLTWILIFPKPSNLEGTCTAPDKFKGIHLTDNNALTSEALAEVLEQASEPLLEAIH